MAAAVAENVVSFREARAKRIRELAAQWADNAIQLGKELVAVRDSFPTKRVAGASYVRPDWEDWCKKNLDFTAKHAARFIRIAEVFGQGAGTLRLKGSAYLLDYLARDTIPEEGRKEVIERLQGGEVLSKDKATDIVNQHRPAPDEARKIAKETGKPTLARDGNIYLGATKAEEKNIERRRELVFDTRRAVETLSGMKMTPEEFLEYALPHQLWNKKEEGQIHAALDWLTDLATAWERR